MIILMRWTRRTTVAWPSPLSANRIVRCFPLLYGLALLTEYLGGHTYCAISSLDFLSRTAPDLKSVPLLLAGSDKFESLITWLASRQTARLEEDENEDGSNSEAPEGGSLDERVHGLPDIESPEANTIQCAGFNGRCNKFADTCYSFWNGATLVVCYPADP
jgi:geranylgeranyl transferase type-1 subunit beta